MYYLRTNDSVWAPPCVIVVHTVTTATEVECGTRYDLSGWTLSRLDTKWAEGSPTRWGVCGGTTTKDLVDSVQLAVTGRETIWLYMHGLARGLAITGLRESLTKARWRMTKVSLLGATPWMVLQRGSKRLTIVDSQSILPKPTSAIARRLGPLPTYDLKTGAGAACDDDQLLGETTVLVCALVRLLWWWHTSGLGRWSVTGPSLGWHAMRHKLPARQFLLDPDPEVKAEARRAIYGGRRDCTQVGQIKDRTTAELDIVSAYLTACATMPLPWRTGVHFNRIPLGHPGLHKKNIGFVANVKVKTDRPLYPVRVAGSVIYPVGTYWTVLATPDIKAAMRRGHLLEVGAGHSYALGDVLSGWARWALSLLQGEPGSVPEIVKPLVKGWSHTVTGRFAARGTSDTIVRATGRADFYSERVFGLPDDIPGVAVTLDGLEHLICRNVELDDTMPGVLAHVESYIRVALTEITELLGEQCWLLCDTDGLTIDIKRAARALGLVGWRKGESPSDRGLAEMVASALSTVIQPLSLRVKSISKNLRIMGPQHTIADHKRKLAGISGDGEQVGPDLWTTNLSPGLLQTTLDRSKGGYVRRRITARVPVTTAHRWVHYDGTAVSPRLTTDDNRVNRPMPADERAEPLGRGPLMDRQSAAMTRLQRAMGQPNVGPDMEMPPVR